MVRSPNKLFNGSYTKVSPWIWNPPCIYFYMPESGSLYAEKCSMRRPVIRLWFPRVGFTPFTRPKIRSYSAAISSIPTTWPSSCKWRPSKIVLAYRKNSAIRSFTKCTGTYYVVCVMYYASYTTRSSGAIQASLEILAPVLWNSLFSHFAHTDMIWGHLVQGVSTTGTQGRTGT